MVFVDQMKAASECTGGSGSMIDNLCGSEGRGADIVCGCGWLTNGFCGSKGRQQVGVCV
jgi:hypothetical protein